MDITFILMVTILPFLSGPYIFLMDTVYPVIPLILGLGMFKKQGSFPGVFLGFVFSFSIFRMLICLLVKITEMQPGTLQSTGAFFLFLSGAALLFPGFTPWNWTENGFKQSAIYSSLLGFLWAFWVGLSKAVFTDYYEPEWVGPIEIYLSFMSSLFPGIILACIGWTLAKIYPADYKDIIQKIIGLLTILVGVMIMFHGITIRTTREELKPKPGPRVQLHELFQLPQQ